MVLQPILDAIAVAANANIPEILSRTAGAEIGMTLVGLPVPRAGGEVGLVTGIAIAKGIALQDTAAGAGAGVAVAAIREAGAGARGAADSLVMASRVERS